MADLPDSSWSRRVNISNGREIFVVPMLTAENVMRMLLCSRSSAYEHMNRAPWQDSAARTIAPGSTRRVRELRGPYAQARSTASAAGFGQRARVGV